MPSNDDKVLTGEAAAAAAQMRQLLDEGWKTCSLYMVREIPVSAEHPQGGMEAKIINLAPLTPLPLILEGVKMWIDTVIQSIEAAQQAAAQQAAEETMPGRRTKSGLHLLD